jgi:hypothetical protein
MQAYRCFLLDEQGRFAKLFELHCSTDEQAEQRCREILHDKHHSEAELWRGSKFLRCCQNSRGPP